MPRRKGKLTGTRSGLYSSHAQSRIGSHCRRSRWPDWCLWPGEPSCTKSSPSSDCYHWRGGVVSTSSWLFDDCFGTGWVVEMSDYCLRRVCDGNDQSRITWSQALAEVESWGSNVQVGVEEGILDWKDVRSIYIKRWTSELSSKLAIELNWRWRPPGELRRSEWPDTVHLQVAELSVQVNTVGGENFAQ